MINDENRHMGLAFTIATDNNSYSKIKLRVDLSIEHFKKPCLNGTCEQDGDVVIHCERHQDTSAIVRRYLRLKKYKESLLEENTESSIESCMGPYRHADRVEWRRRFPI